MKTHLPLQYLLLRQNLSESPRGADRCVLAEQETAQTPSADSLVWAPTGPEDGRQLGWRGAARKGRPLLEPRGPGAPHVQPGPAMSASALLPRELLPEAEGTAAQSRTSGCLGRPKVITEDPFLGLAFIRYNSSTRTIPRRKCWEAVGRCKLYKD